MTPWQIKVAHSSAKAYFERLWHECLTAMLAEAHIIIQNVPWAYQRIPYPLYMLLSILLNDSWVETTLEGKVMHILDYLGISPIAAPFACLTNFLWCKIKVYAFLVAASNVISWVAM